MVTILSEKNSIFSMFLAELRNVDIQKDNMRFRHNLTRLGEIMAYEISKNFNYKTIDVTTPLGVAKSAVYTDKVVLAVVLRAGLPVHQGFLNYLDRSENAFISAYRKYNDEGSSFTIEMDSLSSPSISNKTLILIDTMLASGASMVAAYKNMLSKGRPAKTYLVSLIASQSGLDYVQKHLSDYDVDIWLGAVDPILNTHSYIVPGLGDAGDLAYGEKIS